MRLAALTWPYPLPVRLGWATAGVNNPAPGVARGRAFLFRGQGVVFSRGLGVLCGRMRRAGWWAEDLLCAGDGWACRALLADPPSIPIVFIGHSCGGRAALRAAGRLAAAGLGVDLVVCLDTAFPPPVPANVRRAVHLYRGGRRVYPARPLRPGAGSAARVENIDVTAADSPVAGRGLHHLNFTDRPAVQEFVVQRVREAAGW
jgi:hypothetical protein